jgi:hypothetical protein
MCKHNNKHQNVTSISRCSRCGCRNRPATEKSNELNICSHCYQVRLLQDSLKNNELTVEQYEAILAIGE